MKHLLRSAGIIISLFLLSMLFGDAFPLFFMAFSMPLSCPIAWIALAALLWIADKLYEDFRYQQELKKEADMPHQKWH